MRQSCPASISLCLCTAELQAMMQVRGGRKEQHCLRQHGSTWQQQQQAAPPISMNEVPWQVQRALCMNDSALTSSNVDLDPNYVMIVPAAVAVTAGRVGVSCRYAASATQSSSSPIAQLSPLWLLRHQQQQHQRQQAQQQGQQRGAASCSAACCNYGRSCSSWQ
jgi:hypothetical protein